MWSSRAVDLRQLAVYCLVTPQTVEQCNQETVQDRIVAGSMALLAYAGSPSPSPLAQARIAGPAGLQCTVEMAISAFGLLRIRFTF